jgi:hypothetical protein
MAVHVIKAAATTRALQAEKELWGGWGGGGGGGCAKSQRVSNIGCGGGGKVSGRGVQAVICVHVVVTTGTPQAEIPAEKGIWGFLGGEQRYAPAACHRQQMSAAARAGGGPAGVDGGVQAGGWKVPVEGEPHRRGVGPPLDPLLQPQSPIK